MRFQLTLAALGLLLLPGCASRPAAGACPETRNTRCLTKMVCAKDTSRGCLVCTCEPPFRPDNARDDQSGSRLPAR
jgi:hypothetical protein